MQEISVMTKKPDPYLEFALKMQTVLFSLGRNDIANTEEGDLAYSAYKLGAMEERHRITQLIRSQGLNQRWNLESVINLIEGKKW
jgi:hypothetical protein